LDAVIEHSVRGVARARPDVAVAGRRDLANGLVAGTLFCGLLANLRLHLKHAVDLDRVVEVRRTSAAAELSFADAIGHELPVLGRSDALNVLLAAWSLAAHFWHIAHPLQMLIDAFAEEPQVPPDWNLDFRSALTQLLTATCVGLLSESAERNQT
jgi:hypothetical protein